MSYAQQERRSARKELGGVLLALADDTIRKLNQEEELDQGYIIEDLLGRLVEIAANCGESPDMFETTFQYAGRRYMYPIQEPETAVAPETQNDAKADHAFRADYSPNACTVMVMRDGGGDACGLPPSAHTSTSKHTFIATLGSSGCGAMLKPANRVTGERPVYCTLPKSDSVHKFEEFK